MSMLSKIKLFKTISDFFIKIWNSIGSSKEEWTVINGYDGKYHISTNGKIYNSENDFILKTFIKHDGYERVILYDKKGNTKEYRVHRLVAQHFVDNPDNKKNVIHFDKDKSNNKASNLRWK